MHKILLGAFLLIANTTMAQVDSTDNFDYSKFGVRGQSILNAAFK